VLLISLAGTGISYIVFGLADQLLPLGIGTVLAVLFFARILDGITGGNISTAQAYIADITRPEERAKGLGLIGAAFGLGFMLGPAIGGLLSTISLSAPAYAAAGLTFANVLFGLFRLPESAGRAAHPCALPQDEPGHPPGRGGGQCQHPPDPRRRAAAELRLRRHAEQLRRL